MASLRAAARRRATERQAKEARGPLLAEGPPVGSQECPMTPLRSPATLAYTWERTSPVNGRASGVFVLHLGSTPQPSPMSRDPPNILVNRRQLKETLHGNLSCGRRGEGGVKRRLEDPLQDPPAIETRAHRGPREVGCHQRGRGRIGRAPSVARRGSQATNISRGQQSNVAVAMPLGWEPPQILSEPRSPILLRPRILQCHGTFQASVATQPRPEREDGYLNARLNASPDVSFFHPGASPPATLVQDPVYSPSEHNVLDNCAFEKIMCVTVRSEILDLDPGLVGDADGVNGFVVSRFYHHVTGTPMFQVDFGGGIGARSVRVSDTSVDVARNFKDTQRTLFADNENDNPPGHSASGSAGANQPTDEDKSDEDHDWQPTYEDFQSEQATSDSNFDLNDPSFMENALNELGLYKSDEDVSTWPFEKIFSDDQWQDQSITLVQNTENFSGPEPGPTSAAASRPIEYFLRYWPPAILQRVVDETNRYAAQPSQANPTVTNGRADWTALDAEELLAWFGILMLMGLKEFPHTRCYWDRRAFYNCPLISEAMSRNRFEAIIRCLHLVDNEVLVTDRGNPTYDKLAKVRWLCESFASMSQSLYNNERILTVDEIMVPYKGRFCNIRQYMKSKPVKFGVKVWALANSVSRYVSNVIVYLGADDERAEGDSVGEDAVLTAVRGLEGRGHVIITDNFFTSPRLFMELLKRGFWATGTCRKTRKGFPASLAGFSNTELPERGHLVLKMHRSRSIAAICWMDAKPVFLLSTACDPIGEDSYAGRWVGRERVEFPTSPILLQYQAGMRGVDIVDQQRQEYSTQLHSHKWWHRIFMFILDSQLLNSYILYAADCRTLGLPVYSRSLWHYTVAQDLIKPRMIVGHIRGPIRNLVGGGLHFSCGHPMKRRRCVVCNRRTRRMCPGCGGMFQCEGVCYHAVHTQPRYHANMRGGAV